MTIKLTINTADKKITHTCENSGPLSDLLRDAGVMLDLQCGGLGTCGKCAVILQSGTFLVDGKEIGVDQPESALACRTEVISESAKIAVPKKSILNRNGKISSDFLFTEISSDRDGYALAVDIGTTTVAAILIDRRNGTVLASAASYNQQMSIGEDVSARISYADQDEDHLEKLQKLIIDKTIKPLIRELSEKTGIPRKRINSAAISGNTVMSHLFCGISPHSIGQYPYTPAVNEYPKCTAGGLGLAISDSAEVYVLPSISGYLGGDVVADIYVTKMNKHTKEAPLNELMIDLGTNSEIVLRKGAELFATSAAAGPAFEGAGLIHGMRGITGGIEKVTMNGGSGFVVSTVGNTPPAGICGSGIIDFVACAFRNGIINKMGRFNLDALKSTGCYKLYNHNGSEIHSCILSSEVVVTERDIEQVLKAKSAIYAGIKTLLANCGLTWRDLDSIILSGGFARYININSTIEIGMLPPLPPDRWRVIGNGSLAGAYFAIQKENVREIYSDLIDAPNEVHLNQAPDFELNFIDSLALPHFSEKEFE